MCSNFFSFKTISRNHSNYHKNPLISNPFYAICSLRQRACRDCSFKAKGSPISRPATQKHLPSDVMSGIRSRWDRGIFLSIKNRWTFLAPFNPNGRKRSPAWALRTNNGHRIFSQSTKAWSLMKVFLTLWGSIGPFSKESSRPISRIVIVPGPSTCSEKRLGDWKRIRRVEELSGRGPRRPAALRVDRICLAWTDRKPRLPGKQYVPTD